jgi:cytochrome oxidase Cu insertion factor (SCO1/SenC/PrrC family)
MNNTTTVIKQKSNTTLWILIAMSVLPFIAAYGYYYLGDFKKFSNSGDLINPVIDISTLQLTNESGALIQRKDLTHKWRMILVVNQQCDTDCKQSLYNMRQINVALGKHYDRFRHMLVHTEHMNTEFIDLMQNEFKDTLHTYTTQASLLNVLQAVEADIYLNSIYIMDPIGNIMMRFNADMDPKLILKDLKRLLKISQIG